MWEKGHTFDEIDNMSLEDLGDVIGYWAQREKIRQKERQTAENLRAAKR